LWKGSYLHNENILRFGKRLLSTRDQANILAWSYHENPPNQVALALAHGVSVGLISNFLEHESQLGFLHEFDRNKSLSRKERPIEVNLPTSEEIEKKGWSRQIRRGINGKWETDYYSFIYDASGEPRLPASRVLTYTEATPERAEELLKGNWEVSSPKFSIRRWFAELALERFQPLAFQNKLSRKQPIFSSTLPYLGRSSQFYEHSVLLGLEVDINDIFVSDMSDVSRTMSGGSRFDGVLKIKRIAGEVGHNTYFTYEQLQDYLKSLTAMQLEEALLCASDCASNYWRKAVPYIKYISRKNNYSEPEVLISTGAKIHEIYFLEERKVEGDYHTKGIGFF
jgi:hypothetical protein